MELGPQGNFITDKDIDIFIEQLFKTEDRQEFDLVMKKFEESFGTRYKRDKGQTRGKFPFGSNDEPASSPYLGYISQPYSQPGSFYQVNPEKVRVAEHYIRRYEDPYAVPMFERGRRPESPMYYVKTEYVPYPPRYHVPYEYTRQPSPDGPYKRNPLKESIELRKVKEELLNKSVSPHLASSSPSPGHNREQTYYSSYGRENFRY
jgi:hypothetical protein